MKFADFEEKVKEVERARAIYRYALDHIPKAQVPPAGLLATVLPGACQGVSVLCLLRVGARNHVMPSALNLTYARLASAGNGGVREGGGIRETARRPHRHRGHHCRRAAFPVRRGGVATSSLGFLGVARQTCWSHPNWGLCRQGCCSLLQVAANPQNYDTWFDYARLEENAGDPDKVREVSPTQSNSPLQVHCQWIMNRSS